MKTLAATIPAYNALHTKKIEEICDCLASHIRLSLKNSESKIWHGSPVWFIEGNPVVSYSVRKDGRVSVLFFSGQSFDEKDLVPEGKFKAAEIFYADVKEIKITPLKRWLKKARAIQWDYKNIIKNKGLFVMEKICSRGHAFYKSRDVPTCPVCWPGRYTRQR